MKKNKIEILFATVAISLMLFSAFSVANAAELQQTHVAKVGNEMVKFVGENATIGFGNNLYGAGWTISIVNATNISTVSFNHHSYKRIIDSQQDSFSILENNSVVQIAEIYSFYKDSIDASLAIKNLQNKTVDYVAAFYTTMGSHSHALINGVIPKIESSLSSGTEIPSSSWGMTIGQLNINWQAETSIFDGGIAHSNSVSSKSLVAFGPIGVGVNDTYSISSVLSQTAPLSKIYNFDRSSGQVSPMIIPIPPGGGGGTSGTGPSNVVISVNPHNTTPGSTMEIKVTSYNAGSGGVSFTLQGETFSGSWNYLGKTGSSISWTAQYGYKALRIKAANSYGTAYSNSVSVYIFNYPQASLIATAYNSNSVVVGQYAAGVSFDEMGTVSQLYDSAKTDIPLYVGVDSSWNSSYVEGIWSFNQGLTVYGSYGFTSGTGTNTNHVGFDVSNVQNSINGDNSKIMEYLIEYLSGIANHFSYGLIPDASLIYNAFGSQKSYSTPTPIPIYFNDTGTSGDTISGPFYDPIYETGSLSDTPIHAFGIKTWNDQIDANSLTNFALYLSYDTTVSFLQNANTGAAKYTASANLIFQINVAPAS